MDRRFNELNRRFPFGDKDAIEGQPHVDSSAGTDIMPADILSMNPRNPDPHGAGPRMEFQITPGRMAEHRPPGLLPANGCLNPDPHPANAWAGHKAKNTYGGVPVEKRR